MIKIELIELFKSFTREDWLLIDSIKNAILFPVEVVDKALVETQRLETINNKLLALGITRPETITKEFVLGMLTQLNAQQFVGEDLNGWVDNQCLIFGSLDEAFNDLVSKYL